MFALQNFLLAPGLVQLPGAGCWKKGVSMPRSAVGIRVGAGILGKQREMINGTNKSQGMFGGGDVLKKKNQLGQGKGKVAML